MKKIKENLIIRHTLEIKLKQRFFGFVDFRGEMTDFFVKQLKLDNVRITGARIDIASEDSSEFFFFGYENFGLQLEASNSFEEFKEAIEKLFSALDAFKKYNLSEIIRLGVRSSIMYQIKSRNHQEIKNWYSELMFSSYDRIEKITGGKIFDTGFVLDVSKGKGNAHIITGPVSKAESLTKYFGNNVNYQRQIPDNGFYIDIDFGRTDMTTVSNLAELKRESFEGVKNIEEIFTGFLNGFKTDEK
jgi:hypothetical protein